MTPPAAATHCHTRPPSQRTGYTRRFARIREVFGGSAGSGRRGILNACGHGGIVGIWFLQ